MAIYWITLFTVQFGENRDAIFISMKTFNDDPIDKYPTFTICFKGDRFHWYHDRRIFNFYALDPTQFEFMLKGELAMMNNLNKTSKLYDKKPVVLDDVMGVDLDQFHLKIPDFLHELRFFTETTTRELQFSNKNNSNSTSSAYMNLSYQTANRICFTRNANDPLKSIRIYDLITLDSSIVGHEMYKDTEIQVYIHHPDQLINSFGKPKYKASFSYFMSQLKGTLEKGPKILEFKISQVKQLRKRADSVTPCSKDIHDHDQYYKAHVIKVLNCIPPYWRNTFSYNENLRECSTPTELRLAHSTIDDPKTVLNLNEIPCNEMILLAIDSINSEPFPKPADISMAFHYAEKTYEEITYTKLMGFEGWLSNVGGFIGIFLGYSILQIPELLVNIVGMLHKQKDKFRKGN